MVETPLDVYVAIKFHHFTEGHGFHHECSQQCFTIHQHTHENCTDQT